MKKMMVCYSNYSGEKSQFFNTYTEKNFNQYCGKNNIDFYRIGGHSYFYVIIIQSTIFN